ncbi:MAG: right-handed parallel beta-helix repeat-containing protein [Micrococcales bacterium]|nr:right-handed parallel beta-helix repeat-containing protein [Micrococcales bacterium]
MVGVAVLAVALAGALVPSAAQASTTIQVGPGRAYTTVKAAAAAAASGSVIEIDAGTYRGAEALLRLNGNKTLTIRGVGKVVLDAAGAAEDGKGIFVVDNGTVTIENITFTNARVPDHNGAGIRLGDGHLTVRGCAFFNNEMGLLTDNLASTTVELYDNEFAYSTATSAEGFTHNVYIGRNGLLVAEGNYSHHADGGHLFKSRAGVNIIRYNRFTDDNDPATFRASYELDLPDGGQALVVGNIFGQSADGDNATVVSFARENTDVWPANELYVAHNTFLSDRPGISPLLGSDPSAKIVWQNNQAQSTLELNPQSTIVAQGGNATFTAGQLDAVSFLPDASLHAAQSGTTVAPALLPAALTSRGGSMTPTQQYQHPASTSDIGPPVLPGAVQVPGSTPPSPQPSPTITVESPTPTTTDGVVTSAPTPGFPVVVFAVVAAVVLVALVAGGALVVTRRKLSHQPTVASPQQTSHH